MLAIGQLTQKSYEKVFLFMRKQQRSYDFAVGCQPADPAIQVPNTQKLYSAEWQNVDNLYMYRKKEIT